MHPQHDGTISTDLPVHVRRENAKMCEKACALCAPILACTSCSAWSKFIILCIMRYAAACAAHSRRRPTVHRPTAVAMYCNTVQTTESCTEARCSVRRAASGQQCIDRPWRAPTAGSHIPTTIVADRDRPCRQCTRTRPLDFLAPSMNALVDSKNGRIE